MTIVTKEQFLEAYNLFKPNMRIVTKEQFLEAYNLFKPNWFILLLYGFHKPSLTKTKFPYNKYVKYFLLALFLVGWFGTVLNWSRGLIGTVTLSYTAGLFIIVIATFIAQFMNNARLRKVMNALGIDRIDYDYYSKKYLL